MSRISGKSKETKIEIKPWEDKDLPLLFQLNAPEMMEHLGGPESDEQLLKRHQRYLHIGDKGCMFSITPFPEAKAAGSVGYWQKVWNDEFVYEYVNAFPSITNPASNAICRKLGFNLISECKFEYPPGSFMQCNDWCLELE